MTVQQKRLLQTSWTTIQPLAQNAGELFYRRLFASEPLIRYLFRSDVKEQARRLTTMLHHIISNLERQELIALDIQKLGQRHNGYGAQPEHYAVVGECLLLTMAEGMGDGWTPALREAWQEMLSWLFREMMRGQGID